MIDLPSLDPVEAAILRLADLIPTVPSQSVAIASILESNAVGVVLAEDVRSDRDSPPIDVSAMDGFAIRLADWEYQPLPIASISAAGHPPGKLSPRTAIRIFTGAPVPIGADTILVRESATETDGTVTFAVDLDEIIVGQHVRRQGENARAQQVVIKAGTLLSAPFMTALATFGQANVRVYQKLRVSILNTGDELIPMGQPAAPWQIRDSNGPFLDQYLKQFRWVGEIRRSSVGDDPELLRKSISDELTKSDVLLLTGGVSMGDYDYVPEMIRQANAKIVFHRLPIRPGRPVLGAIGPNGQLICGLPGNPVSVAVTARRIALPLMKRMAGMPMQESIAWQILAPTTSALATLDLVQYRLCNIDNEGKCQWTPMQGSGDLVALSQSDGFLELPPNQTGCEPFRFYPW